MIHRFQLTCSNGDTLTLAVDMSVSPPTFAAHPMNVAEKHPKEYGIWLHEVIVPALLELAKAEQGEYFVRRGMEELA